MSARIFQSVIVQMKSATDRMIGVIDVEGNVVACSDPVYVGTRLEGVSDSLRPRDMSPVLFDGRTYCMLSESTSAYEYMVYTEGTDDTAQTVCRFAAIALSEAKANYDSKNDRTYFIRSLVSDNTLLIDMYSRAKELKLDMTAPRGVLLIRQPNAIDGSTVEVLQSLFPDRQRDFIFGVNETDVILVKELSQGSDGSELVGIARQIETTLTTELFINPLIGIGSVANHLRELAECYKEAQTAIEVGLVFEDDKTILSYTSLGIGRIIYKLPRTLCEMFLKEVFQKDPIDSLDQETLETINRFFENSLNVSETSRKLFVHRNTLVYRLEKIRKLTGLDLREFDHAIVFKVAMMVKKYLNSQDNP